MGLAASQARLLSMTARISNNEFEQQAVAYSKQRLADDSSQANDEYLDAMNQTKFQVLTGYNGSEACYEDLSYNQLTSLNNVATGKQYLVKNNKGKVLVSEKVAKAYEAGNGDYNIFLRDLEYRQANIDVTDSEASVEAIHEAWDKYLNSVGNSINDDDSEHILNFGYTSFNNLSTETTSFNGYATYNTGTATNGTNSYHLYKDDEGYYIANSLVTALQGDDGNYYAAYQTPEQEGTEDYTKLNDVTVNYDEDKGTFTYSYTNSDGKEKTVETLYASKTSSAEAYLSESEKNYLTKKSGSTYYSEDGKTEYSVDVTTQALNYEGTTESQRELYDYALALTEAYYDRANSNTTGNTSLEYDAEALSYYKNIFNEMKTCGYTTLAESYSSQLASNGENTTFTDSEWFVTQLKAGALTISYYSSTEKSFIGTSLYDDESITEKEDKSAINLAEQQYNARMDKIEREDKQFDMQMNKLESEHSALQTEYDSVAKVISKNVENSFKTFSA